MEYNCAFILFTAIVAIVRAQNPLNLIQFDDAYAAATGARCLDGSPAGYYVRKGIGSGSTRFVIYMQGGGSCVEEADCLGRTQTALGSSRFWAPTFSSNGNLLDDNSNTNPDFYNWNHIYLPYCTGDWFSGTQASLNPWGLFFAGHLQVRSVLNNAVANFGLGSATDILVSGSSAGAIGAVMNTDYILERFPHATVKATPQSSWYYPEVASYQNWLNNVTTPIYLQDPRAIGQLWEAVRNEDCLRDYTTSPASCGSVGIWYNYLKTPTYIINNRFDSQQIFSRLAAPDDGSATTTQFIEYAGRAMRISLQQVADSPKDDGLFVMSCLEHTSNTGLNAILIDGLTYGQSLGDWYFERGVVPHVLIDDCGDLPCTSGCRNV